MVQTTWWFVEPVFNSESTIRERLDQQQLTWEDLRVLTAAMLFGVGALLAGVVLTRILGMGGHFNKNLCVYCEVLGWGLRMAGRQCPCSYSTL